MYYGALYHGDIIEAFKRAVPDCYVRDYREQGGYITVCRGLKTILWGDQKSAGRVERAVPDKTLVSIPRGHVKSATMYKGLALIRPGWRTQFRKAAHYLTHLQKRRITRFLGVGEVFAGVR